MWKSVSLEMTLKPFCADMSDEGFRNVTAKILGQWEPLWTASPDAAPQIMFWLGDGSELLDFSGNLEDPFEYGRYLGSANKWTDTSNTIPEADTLHQRPRLFCENPPVWTYADLKRLVEIQKQTALELYGKRIDVGTTFDPGPEFAVSDFKYNRHPEILSNMLGKKMFIFCYATLHADTFRYAGYPNGIPEGETFGRFLGRQTQCFLSKIGFDFLWFSNGLGFGLETWGMTGAVFDGTNYHPENCTKTGEKIFQFWNDFREECPNYRIENRGTNLSTGLDLATDAVPLKDIYDKVPNILPPPNSPWAALDHDFGLELAGMMTHIAELPDNTGYPFRYYTHDPWWLNSPWLDRYDRMPHDIYLPLSIARMEPDGNVAGPVQLNLLSIDNSWGGIPDQVPQESIPHLLDAMRTAPDQPGPVIWLYPFQEVHDMVLSGGDAAQVLANDMSMITALNDGFPINTVLSTSYIASIPPEKINGRILVAPAMLAPEAARKVLELTQEYNISAIFYGAMSCNVLRDYFGVVEADPIQGPMELVGKGNIDHKPEYSGGPINLDLSCDSQATSLLQYRQDNITRPAVLKRGNVLWTRSTNSIAKITRAAIFLPKADYFYMETLFRDLAESLGWGVQLTRPLPHSASPRITIRVHDNAFYYAIYGTDMTVQQTFSTPDGAPVFRGRDLFLKDNKGICPMEKCSNYEARIFVKGQDTILNCEEMPHENVGMERRLFVNGLKDATVTVRPPKNCALTALTPCRAHLSLHNIIDSYPIRKEVDEYGEKYIAEHVNGYISIIFGTKQKEYFPTSFITIK